MNEIKKIVINSPAGPVEYGIEDIEARDKAQKIIEGAPEAYDTLKEIAEYIAQDGATAAEIIKSVQANAQAIKAEEERALEEERKLAETIREKSEVLLEVIGNEADRASLAEDNIKDNAASYNKIGSQAQPDKVVLSVPNISETNEAHINIPSATETKAGVMSAEDKREQVKMTPLVNGDVIVGQSREVYSRTGKSDNATFLKRTTAGGTSIGGGIATLKQVGGNIVKNNFDIENVTPKFVTMENRHGVIVVQPQSDGVVHGSVQLFISSNSYIDKHMYYTSFILKSNIQSTIAGYAGIGYDSSRLAIDVNVKPDVWTNVSNVATFVLGDIQNQPRLSFFPFGTTGTTSVNNRVEILSMLSVDLTEMFGAGNEPTKEECDKMFGTMDALPQGLTIANPTSFKSVGYNQANPANILVGKGIENGAIVDKADSNIAVIECLPCKIGVGENNGYCIHGDFAEGEEHIYLSPLNPMTTEGELYMHQLYRDGDKGTYVPQIKGYMLVEVPDVTNLCVHFLWSEDRGRHDYEPYHESVVTLPNIPEMSEWGLAGMNVSEKPLYDIIDVANNLYVKRIKRIDLGSVAWNKTERKWHRFANGDVSIYAPSTILTVGYIYSQPNFLAQYRLSTTAKYNAENNTYTYGGAVYAFAEAITQTCAITNKIAVGKKLSGDKYCANIICANYPTMTRGQMAYGTVDKCIGCAALNPAIYDPAFADMTNVEIQQSLSGVIAYYELDGNAYEEYPIVVTDKNYISNDYGTEEFDAEIPLNANNLYYQRSLVGETRNFLDRLMAGLGTDDVTAIADRIVTALSPAVVNNDIIEE